jgi:pilus assembly protein Flp/PilA
MKIRDKVRRLFLDDTGISSVEYALLLGLIGTAIAAAATILGTQVATNINEAATTLAGS